MAGGEQGGAHLLVEDGHEAVLSLELPGPRAAQLLRAFPLVVDAVDRGWPAARWLAAGTLTDGSSYVLQEHLEGVHLAELDERSVPTVLAANAAQSGLASDRAPDDSAQLEAVLRGDHPWRRQVAGLTAAGAVLAEHGDEVVAALGEVRLPRADLVHGDYSRTNLLAVPGRPTVVLVDCQTLGRGTRVRDLADLYRQTFLYPLPGDTGARLLRDAALAVEGRQVFVACAVAVTYDNLAWWVENKPSEEFDQACARLRPLFAELLLLAQGP